MWRGRCWCPETADCRLQTAAGGAPSKAGSVFRGPKIALEYWLLATATLGVGAKKEGGRGTSDGSQDQSVERSCVVREVKRERVKSTAVATGCFLCCDARNLAGGQGETGRGWGR
jgi:hypothetical protein